MSSLNRAVLYLGLIGYPRHSFKSIYLRVDISTFGCDHCRILHVYMYTDHQLYARHTTGHTNRISWQEYTYGDIKDHLYCRPHISDTRGIVSTSPLALLVRCSDKTHPLCKAVGAVQLGRPWPSSLLYPLKVKCLQ